MLIGILTLTGLLAVSNVQGCMSPEDLISTLSLTPDHIKEAFDALNMDRDDLITEKDLSRHYWHTEAQFAKFKFQQLVDSPLDKGEEVDLRELGEFMEKRSVLLAVYECKYLKSKSLRKWCFADQILTFVYLVLDQSTISTFFNHLESAKDEDELICFEEIKEHSKIVAGFTDDDINNFLLEVGHDDKRITKKEFTEYVLQEDLHDDFRTCRVSITNNRANYNYKCLTWELFEFTKNHITELDVATTFDVFDQNDNRGIKAAEVMKATDCSDVVAKRFIALMDKSKDASVSYGEFRTYIKSHTVKLHLERECSQKIGPQDQEIQCYKEKIIELVGENHTPISLMIADLDMLFVFEELDFSNDGKITIQDDLVRGKNWDVDLATKMVQEMDSPDDDDKDVSLEEFNEYVDEPNMVFGMADCMGGPKGKVMLNCYIDELQDLIKDMLSKDEVEEFFNFYDKDKNHRLTEEEFAAKGLAEDQLDYFLKELGMGDEVVTHREFLWYVRQQELSDMFKGKNSLEEKHEALLKYLADVMTEYDIYQLFDEFDKDDDMEISSSDFLDDKNKVKHLLDKMDKNGDGTVNYIEFWLYLNTPISGPKKKYLEEHCTTKLDKQAEEIACYKEKIFEIPSKNIK